MGLRYFGTYEEYAEIIERISPVHRWAEVAENCVRCELDGGAVVTWWWTTGSVLFQGPPSEAARAKAEFIRLAGSDILRRA